MDRRARTEATYIVFILKCKSLLVSGLAMFFYYGLPQRLLIFVSFGVFGYNYPLNGG